MASGDFFPASTISFPARLSRERPKNLDGTELFWQFKRSAAAKKRFSLQFSLLAGKTEAESGSH
jgi:hypothetical protein